MTIQHKQTGKCQRIQPRFWINYSRDQYKILEFGDVVKVIEPGNDGFPSLLDYYDRDAAVKLLAMYENRYAIEELNHKDLRHFFPSFRKEPPADHEHGAQQRMAPMQALSLYLSGSNGKWIILALELIIAVLVIRIIVVLI